MLDYVAFDNLTSEVKFKLYEDSINHIEFMKGVITNLTTKIPTPITAPITNNASSAMQPPASHSPLVTQPQFTSGKMHIFLPKDLNFNGLVLGDSITNRLQGAQIGPAIQTRGFGGARIEDLLVRVQGTRKKQIDWVTLSVGINNCMSNDFNITEAICSFEKLVYLSVDKFNPTGVSIASICPLGTYRKAGNVNVDALNKALFELVNKLNDVIPHCTISYLDLHTRFMQSASTFLSSDGLHPSLEGVKALVYAHRDYFKSCGVDVSDGDITARPRPFTPRAPEKPSASSASDASQQLMNSFKQFISTVTPQ